VPREALDAVKAQPFTIAGTGAIESLNVAAAVNICQYELHRPT
jgi:TrmH family RNA methyltransferase